MRVLPVLRTLFGKGAASGARGSDRGVSAAGCFSQLIGCYHVPEDCRWDCKCFDVSADAWVLPVALDEAAGFPLVELGIPADSKAAMLRAHRVVGVARGVLSIAYAQCLVARVLVLAGLSEDGFWGWSCPPVLGCVGL
jgi:hypothetical protein